MNREKLLIKNTAIVSLGKICTQLITFFLLPLYTAVLSTEEYGVVDLLNTLTSLLLLYFLIVLFPYSLSGFHSFPNVLLCLTIF